MSIIGYDCVQQHGRVRGHLICSFCCNGKVDRYDFRLRSHALSLVIDSGDFVPSYRWVHEGIAAMRPPDFGPHDIEAADLWLAAAVGEVAAMLGDDPAPATVPEGEFSPYADAGLATLVSSSGELDFDAGTGAVIDDRLVDFGAKIDWVDVDEWHARYPGERIAGGKHDILDFGYRYVVGDRAEVKYEPADAGFRKDFDAQRKAEHE